MDHYDFNQDDVSESDMIEGSDSNDNSESDFEGFNSDDVNGAQQRYLDQEFSSESDLSDLDADDDPDNSNSDNNSDTSPSVSDDDDDVDLCVPDLKQNPIKWTQNFQTFNVPEFTGQSGPTLPDGWDTKSMPHDFPVVLDR